MTICPICGNHHNVDGRSLCRECEELDMTAYRITVEVTVIADTEPDPEDFVFEPSTTAGDIGLVMGTPQFEIEEIDS